MTEETYQRPDPARPSRRAARQPRTRRAGARAPIPSRGKHYVVRFTCPEFTSLCPITGQPDFAHIVIDYIPRDWIVESKSLKLYLGVVPQSRRVPRGLHHADRASG